MGWIDGVKLGTEAHRNPIVVYSRCPHAPFAGGPAGSAGTDGCRLWWARTSGGAAHRIAAAPSDTNLGDAVDGTVVFAVQHSTAHEHGAARLYTARLVGGSARALRVPQADGATIDDLSADGTQVAFSEALAPRFITGTEALLGSSQIWLDAGGAAPRLIAQVASDANPVDDSERYFDGITLASGYVYAFLYSQGGIVPPVASALQRIALTDLTTVQAPWLAPPSLAAFGIGAAAFDPSGGVLVLGKFSQRIELSTASASCSTHAGSDDACPVVRSAPVTLDEG